jgi:hypothetical protein
MAQFEEVGLMISCEYEFEQFNHFLSLLFRMKPNNNETDILNFLLYYFIFNSLSIFLLPVQHLSFSICWKFCFSLFLSPLSLSL